MKTQRIITILLTILLLGHIAYDIYFINHYIYDLEGKTSHDYANYNSKIVSSWLGGERLVNTENGMRSATFQKFYSNDFMRFNDSLVRFSENRKIGFFNSNAMKIEIQPRFKITTEFSYGLALAVSDSFPEKYGFINRQGYWKIRPKYDLTLILGDDDTTYFTPRFHGGFCKIRTKKELYAFIDTTGKIKSQEYLQILSLMPGNYRIVEKSIAKWGLIDSTFNETFAPIYRSKEEVIKLYKRTILNKLK